MKYLLLRNNQQIRLLHRFSNYRTKQLFPDFKNGNFLKLETSFSLLPPSRNFTWTGFYATLSQSTPVTFLQNNLIELHQFSGLPWWMIIVLTTLGIRSLIIFPLAVHQNQVIARLAKINSGMGELATELNKEVNVARRLYKWDEKHAKKVFRYQLKLLHNDLVVKNNCHPFKTFLLVMIQIPIWVCFSVSLRNITAMSSTATQGNDITNLNLQTEGILWFSDLTCPDPIFIPLMLMFVNLSLIEIHSLRRIGKETLLQKILLNSSRIISVVVGIAATINPSSVTLYWLCSSTFGIGQSLLLMMPKAKELLRIPRTEKESATPFIDIANNFKGRFKKK